MDLHSLCTSSFDSNCIVDWKEGEGFVISSRNPSKEQRRLVLAQVFLGLVASGRSAGEVRAAWRGLGEPFSASLPHVLEEDTFLKMYAEGKALSVGMLRQLCERGEEGPGCAIGETRDAGEYHDIKAVPAGIPPKFSAKIRKKIEPQLVEYVQSDLTRASKIEDHEKRRNVTFSLLSHGASYRHLEGSILYIPSFYESGKLIPYAFSEHLIWEGVKTISASPLEDETREKGLYICQGTEFWPSQPMMLGSIFANLGKEGVATEPYAYAWRQIHKHLMALQSKTNQLPIVFGHSMGGALATQIALYSHPFIERAYAFNPPVVGERDYIVYQRLSPTVQEKLHVFANIDDIPFWRIGSYVIGKVSVLLGEKRAKYYPIRWMDRLLIVPALSKIVLNIRHMVPAHQDIVFLMRSYVVVRLSDEEIAKENAERSGRLGAIRFISKFYGFVRFMLGLSRKYLRWEKRLDYLKSQLEIMELHELDLKETHMIMLNDGGIEKELKEIQSSKKILQQEIAILESRGIK